MLVLTRKVGESIVVSDQHLVLTVLDVQGGRVRVGVSAPPEIKVHRREVWERLQTAAGPQGGVSASRTSGPG